jgi:hypothetical protein
MSGSTVIQEFLVSIGFKLDPVGERRLLDTLESTAKSAAKVSLVLEGLAVMTFGVVHRIASGFETLSYSAARMGDSVAHINKFGYTISQLGGSVDGALKSLEGLSVKFRESPGGAKGFLETWGVDTKETSLMLRRAKSAT